MRLKSGVIFLSKAYKRNKTDYKKLGANLSKITTTSAYDSEVRAARIKENLIAWEGMIDKHHNIPYSKAIATKIATKIPQRLLLCSSNPYSNEYIGYVLLKHFVNAGVAPSKICIVTLNECYSSIRGFGETGHIKNKIFNEENEVLLIEKVRGLRNTDVKDNVQSFWEDFSAFCRKRRKLNVIMCFDEPLSKQILTSQMGKSLSELDFVQINKEKNK